MDGHRHRLEPLVRAIGLGLELVEGEGRAEEPPPVLGSEDEGGVGRRGGDGDRLPAEGLAELRAEEKRRHVAYMHTSLSPQGT